MTHQELLGLARIPAALGPQRKLAATALRIGPWCWPRYGTAAARAALLSGLQSPPGVPPGSVLLCATTPGVCASLWHLDAGGAEAGAWRGHARDAWSAAAAALPHSVPYLWQLPVRRDPPAAWLLDERAAPGHTATGTVGELDGASFGLSFLLAQASERLGLPVADDVAASACVSASGILGPVLGIEDKLALLEACAPGVRRFFVARDQKIAREALEAARLAHIEVIYVRHAREAIEGTIDDLPGLVSRRGYDCNRQATIDSLFACVVGPGRLGNWSPVEAMASAARARWGSLSVDHERRLAIVEAIAARHARNAGRMPELPSAWVEDLGIEATALIVQCIQQAADTGAPSLGIIAALAGLNVRDLAAGAIRPESTAKLKMLGALARLEAVAGNPAEALARQRRLVELWQATTLVQEGGLSQTSFPLSEVFRLAGALGDRATFAEAELLLDRLRRHYDPKSLAFVLASRARASVQFGEYAEAIRVFEAHAGSAGDLGATGLRWLVRTRRLAGEPLAAGAVTALSASLAPGRPDKLDSLVALDAACDAGETGHAELERLIAVEPYPALHLTAAPGAARGPGAYVSRYYPY